MANSRDIQDSAEINGRTITNAANGWRKTDAGSFRARPWLAIKWKCCGTYSRIYRRADATAYEGRCPKCTRAIRVPVGDGGTSNRFFEAE